VNNAMPVLEHLSEQVYQLLHQQLINRTTQRENKLKELMKYPIKYPVILQKKPWDRTVIYPRYLFESGPMATFPKEFHFWWKKHYQYPESTVKNIKVRLIPTTNRTLARFFIRKKPPRHMLRIRQQ
jgi:hypothetical protein